MPTSAQSLGRSLCRLPLLDGLGFVGNKAVAVYLLFYAQIIRDSTQVKTKLPPIFVSNSADFINHWIIWHCYSSMSSSGVQITGQTYHVAPSGN
jgi:hypothetical protein